MRQNLWLAWIPTISRSTHSEQPAITLKEEWSIMVSLWRRQVLTSISFIAYHNRGHRWVTITPKVLRGWSNLVEMSWEWYHCPTSIWSSNSTKMPPDGGWCIECSGPSFLIQSWFQHFLDMHLQPLMRWAFRKKNTSGWCFLPKPNYCRCHKGLVL